MCFSGNAFYLFMSCSSALSKDAVSFRSNRDLLTMRLARQSDWPAKKADISLLDEEIDKALLYLKQSEALRLAQKPDEVPLIKRRYASLYSFRVLR